MAPCICPVPCPPTVDRGSQLSFGIIMKENTREQNTTGAEALKSVLQTHRCKPGQEDCCNWPRNYPWQADSLMLELSQIRYLLKLPPLIFCSEQQSRCHGSS